MTDASPANASAARALPARQGPARFTLALCNEVLQPASFAEQCRFASGLGYDALEVAPFTLADDPMTLSDSQADGFAAIARDHGLRITGLHWLLVAPSGLSIVDTDPAVRRRTRDVMARLIELCARLGGDYLVHGSPKQRSVPAGADRATTLAYAFDAFAFAAENAQRHGVVYCIEPLSRDQTDVLNTVAEAAEWVQRIGQPSLRTMIDCSSAGLAETDDVATLIRHWVPRGVIGHIQVNDPNRRGPGQGDMAFGPIIAALSETGYDKVVAVEPFDYQPDGPSCAAWSAGYLRALMQASL